MQAIYDVINNVSYTPNVHEPLRNALRQIMYARANDTRYGSFYRRDTFAFSSEAESKTVFDGIIESYETRVDNWLGYKMADSKERATLVSLAYNSVTGSTDLLGPKLKAAITNDNRAEAWYEIRYNSNGDRGHASRRYSESNMFNLYDSVFDEKGAKEVMRMYEKKQHSVFSHQLSA